MSDIFEKSLQDLRAVILNVECSKPGMQKFSDRANLKAVRIYNNRSWHQDEISDLTSAAVKKGFSKKSEPKRLFQSSFF